MHTSAMHQTKTEGQDNQVIMSLMFRHCHATVKVNRGTNRVVLNEEDLRQDIAEFDAIRDTWMNDPQVEMDQAQLMAKVQNCHDNHNEQRHVFLHGQQSIFAFRTDKSSSRELLSAHRQKFIS